ncbi:hypothetical protein ACQU0X_06555 [Pseudovibrio ascidiaceicola]|uniref:hypothetical protein n=1 Tax=Pseudovibrio ascidiaceicola TaxID=285279 RepID=UPI003D35C23A
MSTALVCQLETLDRWFLEYTKHGEPFSVQSIAAFRAGLRFAIETAKANPTAPVVTGANVDGVICFPISDLEPSADPETSA